MKRVKAKEASLPPNSIILNIFFLSKILVLGNSALILLKENMKDHIKETYKQKDMSEIFKNDNRFSFLNMRKQWQLLKIL